MLFLAACSPATEPGWSGYVVGETIYVAPPTSPNKPL